MRRLLTAWALLGPLGLLAGCSAGSDASTPRRVAAGTDTAGISSVALSTDRLVSRAALNRCPQATAQAPPKRGLPTVTLRCLGAGPAVALTGLRGPAVINFWAGWCANCKQEMPTLEAFAARAHTRVLVLGVVTDDDRRDALSAAAGLGVHYPSVLDTGGTLRRSFGYPGPPVTLFLDRNGSIVHRVIGPVGSLPQLLALVSQHLGVRV